MAEDIQIMTFQGNLSIDTIDGLKKQAAAIEKNSVRNVLLDLGRVSRIDSSGLGAVVALQSKLNSYERRLVIVAGPKLLQQFKTIKMDQMFTFFTSADDARKELGA